MVIIFEIYYVFLYIIFCILVFKLFFNIKFWLYNDRVLNIVFWEKYFFKMIVNLLLWINDVIVIVVNKWCYSYIVYVL